MSAADGKGLRKALYLLAAGSLGAGAMAFATIAETPPTPEKGAPGCRPAGAADAAGPRAPDVACPESLPQPDAANSQDRNG
jgi:hypothetical protein